MMAGMNLNVVSTANMAKPVSSDAPTREHIRRTPETKTADTVDVKTKKQEEAEKPKLTNQETLENVVARSEHGDTVQVSEDGAIELEESREGGVVAESETTVREDEKEEDFFVERPEVVEIERPEVVLPDTETEAEVDGPPYGGYSAGQLEAFYETGKISQYTYDTEMNRREALREEIAEENSAFTNKMTAVSADSSRAQQVDFAIDAALDSESKFDFKDRVDAVFGTKENKTVAVSTDENRKAAARATEEEGRLWDYQLRA